MRSLRNSARVCTSEICLLPISRLRSLPCSESLSIPTRRVHNAPDPCQQRTFNTGLRHLPNRREQSGSHDATIYAVSTAPGRAAIAIIRISGPACINVYYGICPGKPVPRPRYASLRTLYHPERSATKAEVLDSNVLVLFFPGPKSATGEDLLELHIHGGSAVVKAVLNAIPYAIPFDQRPYHHVRYAEPGEFTRRAFYNGRLDLTQIEALGDTLSAETEQQRRLAVRGATNVLSNEYESWRQTLLNAQGELEALIDFSEDQHFDESPTTLLDSVAAQVLVLRTKIVTNIQNSFRGELLRNGISIALLGAPNAGKSSLLNRIIGREAAIVSQEAGTTRDVMEVGVDIGGFYCRFGDLAGLRQTSNGEHSAPIGEVEKEGMRRAKERVLAADIVIVVLSIANCLNIDSEVMETLKLCITKRKRIVYAISKSDLFENQVEHGKLQPLQEVKVNFAKIAQGAPFFFTTCKQAQDRDRKPDTSADPGGIQSLLQGLTIEFKDMTSAMHPDGPGEFGSSSLWEPSLGASERQRILLQQCLQCLDSFLAEGNDVKPNQQSTIANEREADIVVAAEHLRVAGNCLAKITGKGESGDVEEILGVIFEK